MIFSRQDKITFYVEFSIAVLADGEVSSLLASGHVGHVVEQVEDDDIVRGQQRQSFPHLGRHLLHGGLVRPPARHGADDHLVTSVSQIIALIDSMATAYAKVTAR